MARSRVVLLGGSSADRGEGDTEATADSGATGADGTGDSGATGADGTGDDRTERPSVPACAEAVAASLPGVDVETRSGARRTDTPATAGDALDDEAGTPDCVVAFGDALDGTGRLEAPFGDAPVVAVVQRGDEAIPARAVAAGVTDCVVAAAHDDPLDAVVAAVADAVGVDPSVARKRRDGTPPEPSTHGDRYRYLFDHVDDPVYVLDAEGYVTEVNEATVDTLGYGRERLLGAHAGEFVSPADHERVLAVLADLLSDDDRSSDTVELTIEHADGSQRRYEANVTVVENEGSFAGSVGIMRDVSDRHARERDLERYETLVEAVPDPLWATDEQGFFTFANEVGQAEFGYSKERLESGELHFSTAIADEHVEQFFEATRRILSDDYDQQKARIEHVAVTKDGRRFPAETTYALMPRGDEGVAATGIVRDISDTKRLEQRLQVLDRVLRHNLRNELQAVITSATTLVDRLDGRDETGAATARGIRERAWEFVSLSEDIRRIERALEREDRRRVDAVHVVETVVAEFRGEYPAATIETDLLESAPVEADSALDLAVSNLVENAIVHNDRDRPTVRVTVTDADVERGDWVAVRVVDDGPGIPEQERVVVDEDAEATPLKHGSGIGLWAVAWIVQSFGGDIAIDDLDPRGAAVTLTLRRAE